MVLWQIYALMLAASIVILTVLACGSENVTEPPTGDATALRESTPTPEPTATPQPTDTPDPPTPAIAAATATAVIPPATAVSTEPASTQATAVPSDIVPLDPDDPSDFTSRLSEDELDCITDIERLLRFRAGSPEVSSWDVAQEFTCMENETLLHIYLADLAWYVQNLGEVLSEESVSCIRGAVEGIDLRDLFYNMHADMPMGAENRSEAATFREVNSAFFGYFLTMSCLSEKEFAVVGPYSGVTQEEYEELVCVVDRMGGHKGMAKLFRTSSTQDFATALLIAGGECKS